jgi:L-ascorbate metabolism protein UlaG (beta-lactamase superfamily)
MKVSFLGQAGLLFDFDGLRVMVDPYFSNSVGKLRPEKNRRQKSEMSFLEKKPDVLILTHDHLDHADPETLEILLKKHSGICVLAGRNAWETALQFGGDHNYVCFTPGCIWTEGSVSFEAVFAAHSDPEAIGVLIRYNGKVYYITGDTLRSRRVTESLGCQPDVVFLPINGVGNNMNMAAAAAFAKEISARKAVPLHFGMFDDLDPEGFIFENRVIPEIWKEISL